MAFGCDTVDLLADLGNAVREIWRTDRMELTVKLTRLVGALHQTSSTLF